MLVLVLVLVAALVMVPTSLPAASVVLSASAPRKARIPPGASGRPERTPDGVLLAEWRAWAEVWATEWGRDSVGLARGGGDDYTGRSLYSGRLFFSFYFSFVLVVVSGQRSSAMPNLISPRPSLRLPRIRRQ